MGNRASNPQNNNNNLAHLTSNPDFQNVLMGVYRNNDQFYVNPAFYNNFNFASQSFDAPMNPIRIKKTKPKKSKLSLQKSSIQLLPLREDDDLFSISFTFSSNNPVIITLYFLCEENIDPITMKTLKIVQKQPEQSLIKTYQYTAAKKTNFISEALPIKPLLQLKPTLSTNTNETFSTINEYFLIIKLETDQIIEEKEIIYSYCNINQGNLIEVVKQKMELSDKAYLMHEIYGHNSKEIRENEDRYCAVCLTDFSDIICFPCEHMCLCYKCSQDLRTKTSKCPICRKNIENFIKVHIKKARDTSKGVAIPDETKI